MKSFTIYGNCQTGALAHTLQKSKSFSEEYILNRIKPVQNIQRDEVQEVENVLKDVDLLINQIIADSYHIEELSSSTLKKVLKKETLSISFPSLYFNAYFPHLDMFRGQESILSSVHDYIVMYAYLRGMNVQEVIDLVKSNDFYDQQTSKNILFNSIEALKQRENLNDIKIADYISNNYQEIKLFNQFNHPKGIVFDYIANQILDTLGFEKIKESIESRTSLDWIMTPIYRSTYKNLNLNFEEDFDMYSTVKGMLHIDEVIYEWYKFYDTIDRGLMENEIKTKKPFIVNLFKRNGI